MSRLATADGRFLFHLGVSCRWCLTDSTGPVSALIPEAYACIVAPFCCQSASVDILPVLDPWFCPRLAWCDWSGLSGECGGEGGVKALRGSRVPQTLPPDNLDEAFLVTW